MGEEILKEGLVTLLFLVNAFLSTTVGYWLAIYLAPRSIVGMILGYCAAIALSLVLRFIVVPLIVYFKVKNRAENLI